MPQVTLRHPSKHSAYRSLKKEEISEVEPLLVEVLRNGRLVYEIPSLEQMRAHRQADLERLDPGVRRIMNPHIYHVSLTQRLWDMKQDLIQALDNG